tara:strand:+ start:542 stop:1303 length:762 start_codon:yes stop_codon:yes gene_type:complete
MLIENSIFFDEKWIWSHFLKYIVFKLKEYRCLNYEIPENFLFKQVEYGARKHKDIVNLATWGAYNNNINQARAVCIDSPKYSVLNFLIIPNTFLNMPFFGVDFVSLPNIYLIVLDFQPSIKMDKQFDKELLDKLIKLKNSCHSEIPLAEEMSEEVRGFFSPGLIWAKLSKEKINKHLIDKQLYYSFKEYLNLYLVTLFNCQKVDNNLQKEISTGQNNYLRYRKLKDPARPMLRSLFGEEYTEALINDLLFAVR